MNATPATMTFNHDLGRHGNCEVRATCFLGRITLNGVRRNSDYRPVDLTPAEERDLRNVAGWYFEDATVTN